jgi:hypothetical protein
MNLQLPCAQFVPARLAAAFAVSATLHLLLLWPSQLQPQPVSPERTTAQRLILLNAAAAHGAFAPGPEPEAVSPRDTLQTASAAPIRLNARPAAQAAASPPTFAPTEATLRALRFALARGVAAAGVVSGEAGAWVRLEMRFRARHVIDARVVRTSGDDAFDARVLSAFKAAARHAVIPDSLQPDSFVVELELEGGDLERVQDEHPLSSG